MTADADDTPPLAESEDERSSLFDRAGGTTATAEADVDGADVPAGPASDDRSTNRRPEPRAAPGGDGRGPDGARPPAGRAAEKTESKSGERSRSKPAKAVEPGEAVKPAENQGSPEPDGRRFGRKARRKLRARRVERIVRRVDPWSVMKLSFLFLLCLWVIFMMAGVILWTAAVRTGAIDNVENFVTELFALESFEFEGDQLFRGSAVGGLILVLVGTGFSVLLAVLFNLISDLTGGIRLAVVELENLRDRKARSRSSTE